MRSLFAIQNPGLGDTVYRPQPIEQDADGNWIVYDYSEVDKAAEAERKAAESAKAAESIMPTPSPTPEESPEAILANARRYQFLATTRPGFDYGARSNERNAFFAKDSGLGFDLFQAVVSSLKTNAPQAFAGVKGSEVVKSILPNAGGPSALPKVTLPSWIPKISVPLPLQDAARRAAQLAAQTAKDVAAKKKAESTSGVAIQTFEISGSPIPTDNTKWIVGGAAVLALAFLATRGKR